MHISKRNVNVYLYFLFMFSSVFRNGFELTAELLVMIIKNPLLVGLLNKPPNAKQLRGTQCQMFGLDREIAR